MSKIFKMVMGLIIDDWWLALGLLISIILAYLLISNGMDAQFGGWLLLILVLGTLILSLVMEYRKKMKKEIQ